MRRRPCPPLLTIAAALSGACGGSSRSSDDLSPNQWPAGELAKFTELNRAGTEHPLAVGQKGIVAGLQNALAVRAGVEVLRRGGNAADAALATSFAQITVQTGSGMSFAGRIAALYYDAASGQVHAMNAGFHTVRDDADPGSIPSLDVPSGRATPVPGFMAGAEELHARFGKLPFGKLFEPALFFADSGITLRPGTAASLALRRDALFYWAETKAVFTKPNGELYAAGDRFKQPALAQTLRAVAAHGADYMYRGEWAKAFVTALRAAGGKMTLDDLAGYRPSWAEPLRTTYRGYQVVSLGPPSLGGASVLEALNLAEEAGVASYPHYTRSAEALARLIRITRASTVLGGAESWNREAVRRLFPGVSITAHLRATKAWARLLWKKMQEPGWLALEREIVLAARRPSPAIAAALRLLDKERVLTKPRNTDCAVVVDSAGNVADVIHTINALAWGGGLFVGGVSIPNSAAFQQQAIALAGPGAPLPDPLDPLIVLRDGKPVLASCTAGTFLHGATLQSLVNVLDFDMDPKQAVDTPQFWEADVSTGVFAQQIPEQAFPDEVIEQVRSMGVAIKLVGPNDHYGRRGYWVGVSIDPSTGRLRAGTYGSFNGYAVGY